MNVLALDPGKTTGAVIINWDGGRPAVDMDLLLLQGQIPFEDMPRWLDTMLPTIGLVVIERFIVNQRTMKYSRQPEPMHVIGGTLFLAALAKIPVREQSAADAKTIYSDQRLKDMGWYNRIKGDHARDALRHALLTTHKPFVHTG